MAEEWDDSRTEAPTPRRRQEAHEQGRSAFSAELITGSLVLVGAACLAAFAPQLGAGLLAEVRFDLLGSGRREMTPEIAQRLLADLSERGLNIIGLMLGLLFAAGLVAGLAQIGFRLNPDRLTLNWGKLLPFSEPRLLSWNKVMQGGLAAVKVVLVAIVAYWALRGKEGSVGRLAEMRLAAGVGQAWGLVLSVALALAAALLFLGAAEILWRFHAAARSLALQRSSKLPSCFAARSRSSASAPA